MYVTLTEVAAGMYPEEVATDVKSPPSSREGQGENVTEKHVVRLPVYSWAAGELAFVIDHCTAAYSYTLSRVTMQWLHMMEAFTIIAIIVLSYNDCTWL